MEAVIKVAGQRGTSSKRRHASEDWRVVIPVKGR